MKTSALFCAVVFAHPAIATADPMSMLVRGFCAECHGRDDPEGELRLDRLGVSFYEDTKKTRSGHRRAHPEADAAARAKAAARCSAKKRRRTSKEQVTWAHGRRRLEASDA